MIKYCLTSAILGGVALAALAPFTSAVAGSVGTENVVYYFQGTRGAATDAAAPAAGLIADQDGNFYGTSKTGGAGCPKSRGCGAVFKIPAGGGSDVVLYSFNNGADGGYPESTLVMDGSGNLYGTTTSGGANGFGTVFEVAPNGAETVLYSFQGGNDGAVPTAGLVADASGNLYGTTSQGGGGRGCGTAGCGTVFEIASGGGESVLYRFTGAQDGWTPMASLAIDASGNLYGTTEYSGNRGACASNGCGTVFKLSGSTKTILHTFGGSSAGDGANPVSNVILDASGNLYGTTMVGGTGVNCGTPGCGTVYKTAPNGSTSILYSFKNYTHPNMYDGAYPEAGLLMDASGNIFGTTAQGGNSSNRGTVFELSGGTETVLFTFLHGTTSGYTPLGSLIEDASGNLYGTTF